MNKDIFKYEYLAPDIKIISIKTDGFLCVSVNIDVDENPFDDNTEDPW